MKISCEVIRDLLPLYQDGVCSEETRSLVETHLENCITCSNELSLMKGAFEVVEVERNLDEAKAMTELSETWRKGMVKSILKGAFCGIVALLLIAGFLSIFVGVSYVM